MKPLNSEILKAIGTLGLISTALSGCMTSVHSVPCGVSEFIEIPKGTLIQGVPLPTDEPGKKYNIVTPDTGFWAAYSCHNRMEKMK